MTFADIIKSQLFLSVFPPIDFFGSCVVLVRQIRDNALTSCFEREVARVRDYMLEGGCKFGRDGNNPAGLSKVSTSGSTRLRSTSGRKTSIVSSL